MAAIHGVYARNRESRDFRLMQINKMKENLIQHAKECEIAAEEGVKNGLVSSDSKPGEDIDKPLRSEDFEWNLENELFFLNAMMGQKPVGINKHFAMMLILLRFEAMINHSVDSQVLWDRLNTLYNMEMLHDSEVLPFPNFSTPFTLPEDEFVELKNAKLDTIDLTLSSSEADSPPEPKRELKRELQVYKGMKDLRKEANSKDAATTKETPVLPAKTCEPAVVEPVAKDNKIIEEIEQPASVSVTPTPSKKHRPSTPHERKNLKESSMKKDARATLVSAKERKQGGGGGGNSEKETTKSSSTPASSSSKTRTSVAKKETPQKDDKSELRKDRVKELTASGGSKRSTRGSITDSASNKSASPVTTLSNKRKRT